METLTTTNNIKFNAIRVNSKGTFKIAIRLNDECKNGHNDFSITGEWYEPNEPLIERNMISCGAMGETIAKYFPEFKIFDDLHLCDAKGAPMYAEANGFYHLKNSSKELFMNYMRINEDEYNVIRVAENQTHFTYLLDNVLHIPARWEVEAKAAIAKLEEMTGEKFEDDSKRYQFTPLSAEIVADIANKIETGYYTSTEIEKRAIEAKNAARLKVIEQLTAERDAVITKAVDKYNICLRILELGYSIENFIYYDHTKEAVFNWSDLSYKKVMTQQEFDNFLSVVDYSKLPAGIKFKLGK